MCAPLLDLPPRDLRGLLPLLVRDQILEQPRSDDVGALTDDQGARVLLGFDEVDARVVAAAGPRRDGPRRLPRDHVGNGLDVRGGRATTSADNVEPALVDEAFELRRQRIRGFQVLAVLVREPGVGMARRADTHHLADGPQVVGHELRPCCAVETDREEVGMRDRRAKRLGGLPGQHGAQRFNRPRDHGRDAASAFPPQPLDGDERRLDVARVVAGLEQQHIHAALQQGPRLLVEVLHQLRKGHPAGHRDRFGRRAHRAGDEAGFVRRGDLVGRLPREPRRNHVQLVGLVLQPVLGEHEPRATEGVGRDHVGARREVGAVDAHHEIGSGAHELLVAPLERGAAEVVGGELVLLEHGAHGPIEHEHTLLEDVVEPRHRRCRHVVAAVSA